MSQPTLFSDAPRPRKRINVPRTSVEAYRSRPRTNRIARVLDRLAGREPMTAVELAALGGPVTTDAVLDVRRGLSDALAGGLVCHGAVRPCQVTGRRCLTWQVVGR